MFDDRLADEINLLNPAFIVATGDFTEWAALAPAIQAPRISSAVTTKDGRFKTCVL